MTYNTFAAAVEHAGLIPRFCIKGHWQIQGGKYRVDIWPNTRKRGFVMRRHGQKSQPGSVEAAIKLALPPDRSAKADESVPWEAPAETQVGIIRQVWRWLY